MKTHLGIFHCALLGLFLLFTPNSQLLSQTPIQVAGTANKTAASSGNWTSAATWGGSLPANNDRVLIPAGITVTVDSEIATEFKSIRIDGVLKFATNVNTELRSEYIVSNMMGRLEIGTANNPIASGVTAKLVFADKGGTTSAQDKQRFAPGAVLMGPVEMRGQEKTSWTTLSVHPNAGVNSLSLATTPTGWASGDKLVVAATDLGDPTSDDLVEISSINGTSVTLTSSLQKSHKAPAQASDLDVHVANLTRNIKISSENQSVSAKRRGHIMFMHNLDVDVRYVELDHIGRTDKSQILDDYTWDDLQEDPAYDPPEGAFTNPRGRYSLHFHRGGVDPALTPAHVEGVTVNNDPGWGFVNHSSRVNFIKNVTYDVVGGAFNTEAGDETGSFIENIALRTVNPSDPFSNPSDEMALLDLREEAQDFAWQGDAFWFHSAGVSIEGNVAAGVSGHAFIFWPEGLIEKGLGMMRGTIPYHITDPAQAALLNGVPSNFVLECWFIPHKLFKDNIAYTSTKGLSVYYLHTRFLDTDSDFKYNIPTEAYRSSLNAVFDGTTIWNIRHKGVEMLYASDVTIQNSRIVGYGSNTTVVGMDLDHFHNLDDWFFLNNTVEGFNNSNIGLSPPPNAAVTIDGGIYNNSSSDISIRETNFSIYHEGPLDETVINRTMTISNMAFSNPNNNIVMNPQFTLNQPAEDGFDFGDEVKYLYYFGLGDEITLNYGPFQNATLYFDEQEASYIPITNSNYQPDVPPGDPPGESIPAIYRNKTNAELQGIFNPPTSFGGELLPATAVGHSSIVGGKVSAVSTGGCEGTVPNAPSLVTASNNNCNSIDISWTSANCADNYQIQRKVGAGNWITLNSSVSGTSYTDTNPAEDSNQYRVRAQNTEGNSSHTNSNVIDCTSTPTQYTLTVNVAGTGSGTVTLSPAGGTYNAGTVVTITANADAGSQFDNWSGAVSGSNNPTTITMNSNATVTANFSTTGLDCDDTIPNSPSLVTASNNDCNTIDISWTSSNCADNYRIQRKVGTGNWVTLSSSVSGTSYTDTNPAEDSNQYRVRAQNIEGNSSNTNSNIIDCTSTPTQYTLTVNVAGTGSGTVSLNPAGGTYDAGTIVTLTASANSGSQFNNWSGAVSGSNNPTTITMNSNAIVTANFSTTDTGCDWSIIDSNGFESGWGIWNDGGSDSRRSIHDDEYATTGEYCVRLRDNTNTSVMTTDNLDLSTYEELKVEFAYYPRSMDNSNEDFWLQISTNGGDSFTTVEEWNRGDEFVNNEYYSDEVIISGVTFTDETKLRFRCDASGNSDWVYIDDVTISACGTGGGGDDGGDDDDDGGSDGNVEVVNFSFEEPGYGDFIDDFSEIPGWNKSGDGDSGIETGFGDPTHGDWLCYHEAGDSYINQTLNHAIEAGKTYVLKFDARDWEDEGAKSQVLLRHGSTTIKNVQTFLNDDWQTITVSFNSNDYPNAIGQNLRILFKNNGEEGSYAGFDNFRLTKTASTSAPLSNDLNTVALQSENSNKGLKVSPNPIGLNEDLRIEVSGFEEDARVAVFDVNGRLMLQQLVRDGASISTRNLNVGLYFVKVFDKTGAVSTRFIVKD